MNRDAVRRFYETWNAGDPEPPAGLAEDVEWVNPPEALERGTRTGIAGFRAAMAKVREGFDMDIEIESMVAGGDRVAVVIRALTRGRGSGVEARDRMSHLWTFRDGRVVRFEWFRDPGRARTELET